MKELFYLSKKISKFVVGTEGNISGKINTGFYIKSSGKSLENLKEEDLSLCDMNGLSLDNKIPSIETNFHSWIYKNLNVNFIAHTHPINTLKILCSKQFSNFSTKRLFPDQVVFNGKESVVVDYYHPGELTESIAIKINNYLLKYDNYPKLILLKNHGIITIGKTIEECIVSTEICEKSAEIFLGSLFSPNYLSEKDIDKIFFDEKEKYRQNNINI